MLTCFCDQLRSVATAITEVRPQRIGYRERALIERPMFLVIKEVCKRRFGYELHGLSEKHRNKLEEMIHSDACNRRFRDLVRELFELRVFLLDLSSSNPYVQGDALSRASLTKSDAVRALSRSLHRLADLALEVGLEKNPPRPV